MCCSGSVITHSLTGKQNCMPLYENHKYRLLDITIYSIDMVFKTNMVFHAQQIIIRKWKYSRNDRHITQIVLHKIKLGSAV